MYRYNLRNYVEFSLDSSLPFLSKHLCPTSSSLSHLYRLVLCLLSTKVMVLRPLLALPFVGSQRTSL